MKIDDIFYRPDVKWCIIVFSIPFAPLWIPVLLVGFIVFFFCAMISDLYDEILNIIERVLS